VLSNELKSCFSRVYYLLCVCSFCLFICGKLSYHVHEANAVPTKTDMEW